MNANQEKDLLKASHHFAIPHINTIICDSVPKLKMLENHIVRTGIFCFDAETTGVNHYYDHNTLWTISPDKSNSYIIPCEHDAEGFPIFAHLWQDKSFLRAVGDVFTAGFGVPVILGANVNFDLHRARKTLYKVNSRTNSHYKIPSTIRICDVAIMYHTIDEAANLSKITGQEIRPKTREFVDSRGKTHEIKGSGPYSLKTMTEKFFPDTFGKWGDSLEEYKCETGHTWATVPFNRLVQYAAIDSVTPIMLYNTFKEILIQRDSWSYFWNLRSYMPSIFFHITQRGLYVDIEHALNAKTTISSYYEQMEAEVSNLPIIHEANKIIADIKMKKFIKTYEPIAEDGTVRVKTQRGKDTRWKNIEFIRQTNGLEPIIDKKGKPFTKWENARHKKFEFTTSWQANVLLFGCHSYEDSKTNGYADISLTKSNDWKMRNGENVKDGVKWEDRAFKGLDLPPKISIDKGKKIREFTTGEKHIMNHSGKEGVEHVVYLSKLKGCMSKIGTLPEILGKPTKKEKGLLARLQPIANGYAGGFPRAITNYFFTTTGRLKNANHSDPSHVNSGNDLVDKALKLMKSIYKPTPIYRTNPKTGQREKRIIIKADYKGAEMVALAMFCDAMYDFIFNQKGDLHIANACVAMGITLEKFFADFTAKEQKAMRQKGKAVGFGFSFGMYFTRFVEYARNSYGVEFTDEEAKEIYQRFHDRWGLQDGYYKHVSQFVDRHGFVRSFFGCTRNFFMGGERYIDFMSWNPESKEYEERRKYFRDGLAEGWEKSFMGWTHTATGQKAWKGGSVNPTITGTDKAQDWLKGKQILKNITDEGRREYVTYKDIRKSSKATGDHNGAINAPIQMTIPDIIHLAFSYLIPRLEPLEAWIVKTTHDSMTVECWEGDLFEVTALINKWLMGSQHSERAKAMRRDMKIDFFKDVKPVVFKVETEIVAWDTSQLVEFHHDTGNQVAWLNYSKSTTGDKALNMEYLRRAESYTDCPKFLKMVAGRRKYLAKSS